MLLNDILDDKGYRVKIHKDKHDMPIDLILYWTDAAGLLHPANYVYGEYLKNDIERHELEFENGDLFSNRHGVRCYVGTIEKLNY